MMIRRTLILSLLPGLLAAAPPPPTLADALRHWTGVTADVEGQGEQVRVVLPPSSPVPAFTARALAARRAGDPGWNLTNVVAAVPARLRGGETLTVAGQQGRAWLGARTVDANGRFEGIGLTKDGATTRIDHANLSMSSLGGPVTLALDASGLHADAATAGLTPLLPQHVVLRGHTTPAGAAALSAMADGQHTAGAPLTIDAASLDVGPAHFAGSGTVTIDSPTERHGAIEITASHFNALMQQMPLDPAVARLYPVMMVLRQIGHRSGDTTSWTIAFDGRRVLVGGIDIGPLLQM